MPNQSSLFGSDDVPAPQKKAGQPVSTSAKDSVTPGEPLAARMRPRTLDEIVGQEHLLGLERLLRRTIEKDNITSMILWGPPGSGKTTLAEVIARQTYARFVTLSAVSAGGGGFRRGGEGGEKVWQVFPQRPILFF